jgi:hypothetical protein
MAKRSSTAKHGSEEAYKIGFGGLLAKSEKRFGMKLKPEHKIIADDETFRQWVERLGRDGLKVDGKPFTLENRPAMAFLYDLIPSTKERAFRHMLVLMKCAQVGFTVMEMLATIYMGLKFGPCTIGMFLPDMNLAGVKSSERFIPIVRSVPAVHALMTQEAPDGTGRKTGEGNVTRRRINDALFVFSWTSGRATTESIPMDFLAFDEVQEMTLPQMEKTLERLSASDYRYTLMGSTANWPELDIHHWYKLGKQYAFHTKCPECGALKPLDNYFPACIKWDEAAPDEMTKAATGAYRYVCESGHWIDEPQVGEWIAAFPNAWIDSAHFPQTLSPTITPGEIMNKFVTSTDKKNFYNRVLGKPYLDPDQIPVTLAHMANCVAAGAAAGVRWEQDGRGLFMGIDQMGNYNVVVIKKRLPDGRQAVVHLEEVYSDDPFMRCSDLMWQYGVAVCVVEINPNYNDAKRFAGRHPGKVFICNSFGALQDDMLKWGDAPKLDVSERRTDEEERDRWTVRIDQFKCMSVSLARFTAKSPICLFPDPQELQQDVIDKGIKQRAAVAPRAFHHFTKTALVTEKVIEGGEKEATTNHYRRVVRKVGIDPHFSYANLLCDVAWARAHGTATFLIPEEDRKSVNKDKAEAMNMPGLPANVVQMMDALPPGEVCGRCVSFPHPVNGVRAPHGPCEARNIQVMARDPGCPFFVLDEYAAQKPE